LGGPPEVPEFVSRHPATATISRAEHSPRRVVLVIMSRF
jgi:hypothetical protein